MRARVATRWSVRVAGTAVVAVAVFLASCGTILYPERTGQPPGWLDPGVVILDGVGLLLFLIPGVIAFAVDFATGAIYLPPAPCYVPYVIGTAPPPVALAPSELTPERVAAVVREQTGKDIDLRPGHYRATRLEGIDGFTAEAVAGLETEPKAARVVFRARGE